MKKLLLIMFVAAMTACDNSELESIYDEVQVENDEDVNFRIFKDRTQKGKGKIT